MSKKPPKKPSRRKEPAPLLTDVQGTHWLRVTDNLGACCLRLDDTELAQIADEAETWGADVKKFIAAYKSGRLTED